MYMPMHALNCIVCYCIKSEQLANILYSVARELFLLLLVSQLEYLR